MERALRSSRMPRRSTSTDSTTPSCKARELTGISIEAFCAETPYDIGMAMYKLNEAYQDKFSFYIYYQDKLKTLDEWIRETDLSESFYFGGTLDYHF